MIASLALIIGISSCSKDKDDDKIIGKWQITSVSNPDDYEECDYQGWMELKKDGTLTEYDKCFDESSSGTWKLENGKLTLTSDVFPIPIAFDVKKLSDTELELEISLFGTSSTTKFKKI